MFFIKLFIVVLAAAAALYFFSSLRVRELAIVAARKRCTALGVQFLDQSVSSSGVSLKGINESANGRRVLERRYRFEFTSTGEERYKGNVIMQGNRVAAIEMEAHRIPDDNQP